MVQEPAIKSRIIESLFVIVNTTFFINVVGLAFSKGAEPKIPFNSFFQSVKSSKIDFITSLSTLYKNLLN
ncbi:MAG: hypothetical protein LBQ24_05400 [Candidatus Peribacteria bacterium]|nr:hypothetical protein [Candidatus Peribacteria bacterium]